MNSKEKTIEENIQRDNFSHLSLEIVEGMPQIHTREILAIRRFLFVDGEHEGVVAIPLAGVHLLNCMGGFHLEAHGVNSEHT